MLLHLFFQLVLLIHQHCLTTCTSIHRCALTIKIHLIFFWSIVVSCRYLVILGTKNIRPSNRKILQVLSNIDLVALKRFSWSILFFLSKTGFKMFVHFWGEDVLSANMAFLKYLFAFGLRNDLLLKVFRDKCSILLNTSKQLSSYNIFVLIIVETNCLY